ncbi:Sulfotransferase domain protein [Botrimarina colliarenosi]|uniref:Sulfotransferase domain protein n=1 Tax=Botrimarina colliarenosi TaxID=2528001 RepID=A0A5C6ADD9_9BACT|nr:sulfotransferase [Botrimarina colliarenosi]TWT97619.1 Sulfotransferase domain protein [Botrimarina colliarenosi]
MTPDSLRSPNFFLVGAAKSGTTALAKHLAGHPDVFVSKPKEPNYYAFHEGERPSCKGPIDEKRLYDVLLKYSVTEKRAYQSLFADAGEATAVGEASVRYLYEPFTAARIASDHPDARVLIILRDPVERMHSHYHMNLHKGVEPLAFERALKAEDDRVAAGWGWDWHYRRVGMYAEQVRRFVNQFGEDQVLTVFHRDLAGEPLAVWRLVCEHLRVSAEFTPEFQQKVLVGRTPRSRLLKRLVWDDGFVKSMARALVPSALRDCVAKRVNAANVGRVTPLTVDAKNRLSRLFSEDKRELEEVLGRRAPW